MPPKIFKKYKKTAEGKKESANLSSAKYLIIVESPSKCSKIESYLGSEYCCIASKGHIRCVDGIKSIDTKKTYEATFSIIDEKKQHVEEMKKVVSKFSKENIILASDDDREGEAIAWHICKVFDLPVETTKRIIFHEVTKPALLKSVDNPTIINMNLVQSQQARQVLDIIVGYRISPFLWKYLYNNKSNSLSAGRCQTPALRLVYDNEKEKGEGIETKYKTIGVFFQKQLPFELNYEFDKEEQVLDFLEKSKIYKHNLTINLPKESTKSAPKPFHTSRLLQVANNVLHISPKETMSLCQILYQTGYITYMRTESSEYSKPFLEQAEKYIMEEYKEPKYLGDPKKLENKDASNPHEAIRVTNLHTKVISDNSDTRLGTMYRLIWKNTLESCMADAKYNVVKCIITAPLEKQYEHSIEIPLFLGWKIVSSKTDSTNNEQAEGTGLHMYLKTISSANEEVKYQNITTTVVLRNKHQHYTEASLINKLEDLGIGRPSTFATIVETIQDRGYVKKTDLEGTKKTCNEYILTSKVIEKTTKEKVFGNEKNKLVIQPTGILTVEFLIKNFETLFSYEYTKNMENELDLISSGKETKWSTICSNCDKEIKELSNTIKTVSKKTYPIEDKYDLVFQPYGSSIKHTKDDGEIEYLTTKKDIKIDLEKLAEGGYSLDDLIECKNDCLGKYENEDIYLKNGKFGPYVEWGSKRESIKEIKKALSEVTLDDITTFLKENNQEKEKSVLRTLNENFSIRKGKYGAYVYYKRKDMAKPEFLNIKKFNEGFMTCDKETLLNWLRETYNLSTI
jgi:DNA topoisomerase-1